MAKLGSPVTLSPSCEVILRPHLNFILQSIKRIYIDFSVHDSILSSLHVYIDSPIHLHCERIAKLDLTDLLVQYRKLLGGLLMTLLLQLRNLHLQQLDLCHLL